MLLTLKCWKFVKIYFEAQVVSIMPADGLAPLEASTSAGMVWSYFT